MNTPMIRRRPLLIAAALAPALGAVHAQPPAKKVMRYAFEIAESAIDPAKVNDLYSRTLTQHIFEGLYRYDHLARPVKIKPLTADGMPQVSRDFKVWTVKVRPGIRFADDPAFHGRPRELVAQDFVYAMKRVADPANVSPVWTELETAGLLGLAELRQEAIDGRKKFDYDRELPGLRALDRYTVRFEVREARPRLIQLLASGDLYGAVAREVIEFYGDRASEHPVGTGPFRLVEWRHSSFIAMERNPGYRDVFYDAEPAADDVEGQAIAARLRGRRLPMIDRVEVSIIEEDQPRWLSFVNGEADLIYRVGFQFVGQAMPNGQVAPFLAKKGIHGYQVVESAANYLIFNMEDPVVGGYTAQKVALRRAIGLAMDTATEIAYAYNGQATIAQTCLLPFTSAFDPRYRSEFGDFDMARAKGLLDVYGYAVGSDGWRTLPDGSPLVLRIYSQSDQRSRRISEVMDRNMRALGLHLEVNVRQWPENLKASRAGTMPMWSVGTLADAPDAIGALALYNSREIGGQNAARFKMPEFDRIYDRLQALPDGPERDALFRQAENLAVAFMPYKFKLDRLATDMAYPQVVGYRHPVFWNDWWQYVDIDDTSRRPH